MLRVYHSGKREARHKLIEATHEATTGIRNQLECIVAKFNGTKIGSMYAV
jgi:hypothetical protein